MFRHRLTHGPQATLEIEFMHQTVVQYVDDLASRTLTEIYTTISNAYASHKAANGGGRGGADEGLQQELGGVKQTLLETRRITAIQFKCFRKAKDRSATGQSSGSGAGQQSQAQGRQAQGA